MATIEDKRWSGLKNLFTRSSLITGEEFQPDEEVRDTRTHDLIVAPTTNHPNTKGPYVLYRSIIYFISSIYFTCPNTISCLHDLSVYGVPAMPADWGVDYCRYSPFSASSVACWWWVLVALDVRC